MTRKDFRQIRWAAGMSTQEMADRFGVSRRTVESWECGARSIPARVELALTGRCPTCGNFSNKVKKENL
jgi:DNA-binding transcriptional regulator YiaG